MVKGQKNTGKSAGKPGTSNVMGAAPKKGSGLHVGKKHAHKG